MPSPTSPELSALIQNQDLMPWLLPEVILLIGSLLLLLLGMISPKVRRGEHGKLQLVIACLFVGASSVASISLVPAQTLNLAHGMLQISPFAAGIRTLTAMAVMLSMFLVRPREELGRHITEKLYLMLSMGLGLNLLCLSSHFLTAYIGLEIASISAWILTGFSWTGQAKQAALKYFVFGAVASACMLYGASWIYGLTGSLQMTDPAFLQRLWSADEVVVTMAFGLVLSGILFKISAIPLHFWAPDVYAAAPLPVVALFSTAPKIAALGFLWHLIYAFAPISSCFGLLCLVAGTTLTVGNLAALSQQNFRKLMAWSSIGQGGFLISALLCGTEIGRDAALIYSLFYTIANVCVFELIRLASKDKQHNADYLPSLAGLGLQNKQALYWGLLSLVALLSLVGLPPTGGFTAKFIVFTALLEQYDRGGNWWVMALLILGLLNTVLALFYYLRIPYLLFMRPARVSGQASLIANPAKIAKPELQPSFSANQQAINLTIRLRTNGLVLLLCILLVVGFLKIDWILTLLQLRMHE